MKEIEERDEKKQEKEKAEKNKKRKMGNELNLEFFPNIEIKVPKYFSIRHGDYNRKQHQELHTDLN